MRHQSDRDDYLPAVSGFVSDAASALDGLRERFGSYLSMIPEAQRGRVERMAKESHPHYVADFPEFNEFLEAVAKNWLLRQQAFEDMCRKNGGQFRETVSADDGAGVVVVFTESGSVCVIDTDCLANSQPESNGGSVRYQTVELRREAGLPAASRAAHIFVRDLDGEARIKKGEFVYFFGEDLRSLGVGRTSLVYQMAFMADLARNMERADSYVDSLNAVNGEINNHTFFRSAARPAPATEPEQAPDAGVQQTEQGVRRKIDGFFGRFRRK
jgi:hypothetical protein